MKTIHNNSTLKAWLARPHHQGMLDHLLESEGFTFEDDIFARQCAELHAQHGGMNQSQIETRAAYHLLTAGHTGNAVPEADPAQMPELTGKPQIQAKCGIFNWRALKIAWAIAILTLLAVIAVKAAPEPDPTNAADVHRVLAGIRLPLPLADTAGIIMQFQQAGTSLQIRGGGLVILNCSTNLNCSWSGNTFTLTGTGGAGTGCIPPGSVANAVLYDSGSGACSDVAKMTWNSGTNKMLGLAGATFDFTTSSSLAAPGASGQLLYNNSGVEAAEDPIVSYNYVNLFSTVAATGTATSSAVRASMLSATGTVYLTWAGITGSPATCTIQMRAYDSLGNFVTEGSAFSVTPSNGTTSQTFLAAPYDADQLGAVYSCGTYPSGGTLSMDFAQTLFVHSNLAQVAGTNVLAGAGATGTGSQRETVAQDTTTIAGSAPGTAGTPSANVVTVQGPTSGGTALPVSIAALPALAAGSATIGALTANQSVNTAQVNGATTLAGAGATGTGSQRETVAQDTTTIAGSAPGTAGSASANVITIQGIASGTVVPSSCTAANCKVDINGNAGAAFDQAPGSAVPANAVMIGGTDGTNTQLWYVDPCAGGIKTYLPISEAASSSVKIISGTSSKHTYICSILIVSAAAINFNFLSGTGTNCGTINGSYFGTNTSSGAAANGPNLAANGGFTLGNGQSAVARDNTAADDTCWVASGTTQVSGVVTYVQR